MVLVSVVIPVSDRPKELFRAICSVQSQKLKEIEILVIENNSRDPDGVSQVVDQFDDRRIRLVRCPKCRNANAARNVGAFLATGECVAYLDSDDEWHPDYLSYSYAFLRSSNADFLYGGGRFIYDDDVIIHAARDLRDKESGLDYAVGKNKCWAQTSSFFCKKEVLYCVHWDERLARHQDYDYFSAVSKEVRIKMNPFVGAIVHWEKKRTGKECLRDYIKFHKKWKSEMSAETEFYYCQRRVRALFRQRSFFGSLVMAQRGVLALLRYMLARSLGEATCRKVF